MKLSIVMPAYNEAATLREIVSRVLAVDLPGIEKELLIVDDGSTDGTREMLRELDGKDGVRALFHPRNIGKGAAVWTGMRAVDGGRRPDPGRGPRVRPARVPGPAAAHPRGGGGRRLRLALSRNERGTPRALLTGTRSATGC